jgi:hypothetical protein
MSALLRFLFSAVLLSACAGAVSAQSLPASQPDVLLINIEEIKLGHGAEHLAIESGWPAAYERANSAFPYLALAAMTGTPEVWFVAPYASHTKMAEAFDEGGESLASELARLSRADAEHLNGARTLHAVARKDLSYGAFPDSAKQRFYEITTFRVRPGGEEAFAAAAKAFGAAAARATPNISYRVYEVIAGMPSPTYLLFSSVVSFGEFDKAMTDGMAAIKAMTPQEQAAFGKWTEHAINVQSNRFRLDPQMSYVPRSVKEQDPAFWMPKK